MSRLPNITPIEVKRRTASTSDGPRLIGAGLEIKWSDSTVVYFTSQSLRENCPCATCQQSRGKTDHEKPLTGRGTLLHVVSATAEEETDLVEIWPVGNYAIGLRWGDGHNTGIYSFDYLQELVVCNYAK